MINMTKTKLNLRNKGFLPSIAKKMPFVPLDKIAKEDPLFSYRERTDTDFKGGHRGSCFALASSARTVAILMTYCYSFHVDDSNQLYVVTEDGSLRIVTPEAKDFGVLLQDALTLYQTPQPSNVSVAQVYNAMRDQKRVNTSTLVQQDFFHPEEWDGESRLLKGLNHFFHLDAETSMQNNLAFATMLFQWYGVLRKDPGVMFGVAPIFMSTEQGIGKSQFIRLLGTLNERYNVLDISSWADLKSNDVTSLLPISSLIFYDELGASALRRQIDEAKRIATSDMMTISPKYIAASRYRRRQPLLISTNNESVLPNEANRRFPVIRVSNNPKSPLAVNDIAGAQYFIQQMLNEAAALYDRATDEQRLTMTQWRAEYNADDMDDDFSEVLEVFNDLVIDASVNYKNGVTASDLWSLANHTQATVLLDYFGKPDSPRPNAHTTRSEVGAMLKRFLPKYALTQMISSYNPLVSVDMVHPVISPNPRRSNGRRVRDVVLENHKQYHMMTGTPPKKPTIYAGNGSLSSAYERLTTYRDLLIRLGASYERPVANIELYQARIWCAVEVVKDWHKDGHGAYTKLPISAITGRALSGSYGTAERNGQLADYQTAQAFVTREQGNGRQISIGIHIDANTPLAVMDIDSGMLPKEMIPTGCGVEASVSGTGMHLFSLIGLDEKRSASRMCAEKSSYNGDFDGYDAEIYTDKRVITMTDPMCLANIDDSGLWFFDYAAQMIQQNSVRVTPKPTPVVPEATVDQIDRRINGFVEQNGLSFTEGGRHNDATVLYGFAKTVKIHPDCITNWIERFVDWDDNQAELEGIVNWAFKGEDLSEYTTYEKQTGNMAPDDDNDDVVENHFYIASDDNAGGNSQTFHIGGEVHD